MASPQNNRIRRLTRLMTILHSGAIPTAGTMAEALSVSRRTVFRDLTLLRDAGMPLEFNEVVACYEVSSGTNGLMSPRLSREELVVVALSAHLSSIASLPEESEVIRTAIAKLMQGASPSVRREVARLLRACGPYPQHRTPFVHEDRLVSLIILAIRQQRCVRVRFARRQSDGIMQTKIAPRRLVATDEGWILVGRSSMHRQNKRFLVAELESIELTDDLFPYRTAQRTSKLAP